MKKNQSVSDEYMTVGELAGKMGTTVRTLQYYDKEHLLPPSAESEGGRRLYTYKDMNPASPDSVLKIPWIFTG